MTSQTQSEDERITAIIASIDAMATGARARSADEASRHAEGASARIDEALDRLAQRHLAQATSGAAINAPAEDEFAKLQNANRLVTVGTLTAGMAHELGTPLGVVLARAQMIMSGDADLAEARKDAHEIVGQVKRMTQMCREVLDYARPRAPQRIPVDVLQVLRQVHALLQPDARKRNARLALRDSATAHVVSGDPAKLMQVLTNLVINAAQAMPRGGTVSLDVKLAHVVPPATERLAAGTYVCIHVHDTGVGISAAHLPHIFETFFTTKAAGEGTGLGLAVSARIAREHGGFLGVTTVEGEGSTFTLYLPLAPVPQSPPG